MAEPPVVASSRQLPPEPAGADALALDRRPEWDEAAEHRDFHQWLLEETGRLAKVGGWSFDPVTGEGYWTAETVRIYDLDPQVPVDRDQVMRHYTDESRARIEAAIAAAITRGEPYDVELELVSAAGWHKWVRTIGHVAVEDGRVVRLYGSFQDVTESRRVERELRQAHSFLDSVVDMAPFAMWLSDAGGTIIRVNRALCKMLGVSAESVVGRYNVLTDQNLEAAGVMARVRAVYERHQPVRFGIPWSGAASGDADFAHLPELNIEVSMFPIVDGDGRLTSVVCQWADVTELTQAHQALRASERKFRETVLNLDEGYYRVSGDGVLVDHNRAFNRILGYPEGQDLRGFPAPQFWREPEERTRYAALLADEGSVVNFVMDACTLAGETIALQINAHVVEGGSGGGQMIEGVFSDITELKRAGEAILRMNQELEQRVVERTARLEAVNKELEAFAHSVSHDLRAPLRAIGGLSRMILDEHAANLDDEGRRLFDSVVDNTGKMDQLITDLLALARLSLEGRDSIVLDMTSLACEIFNEVVPAERTGKIEFLMSPLAPARGDRALMRQVWINLLGNAVKFSAGVAEPVIAVGSYIHQDMNVYFVKDNGVGFDSMYASRLFGAFQRLHKASDFEGTGVGLAIVQRIIHLHHGIVWAKGETGEGATFFFALPALGGDE